jgi:hypothetical protein
VRGRLGYSGGVVAEAGASVNGEATRREAVGGERAGDGMGGTKVLTGWPGLPVGEWREGEGGGATDRWGRSVRCGAGASSWAAWAMGGERGKGGRGAAWAKIGPAEGGGFFFFFLFLFSISLFHFLFLFLFISFSFESTIC